MAAPGEEKEQCSLPVAARVAQMTTVTELIEFC
jgi:hypothetical protein